MHRAGTTSVVFLLAALLASAPHPAHSFAPSALSTRHTSRAPSLPYYASAQATKIAATAPDASSSGGNPLLAPPLSITVGLVSLTLLVVNRLNTELLFNSQSRTDLIAVIGAGSLLLTGFAISDVTQRMQDRVDLAGFTGREIKPPAGAPEGLGRVLTWALDTTLEVTPATSCHVLWEGATVARAGVVGKEANLDPNAPILKKAMSPLGQRGGEVHLPDLQILPGKIEFTYLPENCPTLFIVPLAASTGATARGALVFGGDTARRLTPRDLALFRNIGVRVEAALRSADATQ